MKLFYLAGCAIVLLASCTKTGICEKPKQQESFREYLASHCAYHVVEPSTGRIVFDVAELRLNGQPVQQRGIWYFRENPKPEQVFPALKELGPGGYMRDIEIGSSIQWCPNYRSRVSNATVKLRHGNETLTWNNYPVLILEHETLPQLQWPVALPVTIEITLTAK